MRIANRSVGTAARILTVSTGLLLASLVGSGSASAAPQFTVDKSTVAAGESFLVTFPGCTAEQFQSTTGALVATSDGSILWPGYKTSPLGPDATQDSFMMSIAEPGVYALRGTCDYRVTAGGAPQHLDYGTVTVWVQAPTTTLMPGQGLAPGQSITANGHKLVMQTDGNLVAYNTAGTPVWMSGTFNNPGAHAEMQRDGNFVVYSAADTALWQSGTSGRTGAFVLIRPDGAVGVFVGSEGPFWSSVPTPAADEVTAGRTLVAGQELISGNGTYKLAMQTDGNLVVYRGNTALWQSGTGGLPGARAEFRNGNFVVVDTAGAVRWSANTAAGVKAVIQNDGNAVVYPASGGGVWQSGTAGR